MTCPTAAADAPEADGAPRLVPLRAVYEGWGRFGLARLRLADGSEIGREVENHGDAVAVLPYDPDRRLALLVSQLRAPALLAAGLPAALEAPAGRLEGPDPAACAAREVREECGVVLRSLEAVATAWAMPAVSTERIHLSSRPSGRRTTSKPAVACPKRASGSRSWPSRSTSSPAARTRASSST